LLFVIILLVFFNTILGAAAGSGSHIDYLGHLGGAIAGFIWGMAFMPRANSPSGKKMKNIGIGLNVIFYGLCFGLLYGLNRT
jgi:membrane associated rhomboid family serine protease